MPAPTKIYFPQIAVGWEDWVQIVNVGDEPANIMAVARNQQGQTVWSQEVKLNPFQAFTTAADTITVPVSMTVSSDMPIVGERHCHKETIVFNFPGASPENMTVGNRLFFPEIAESGTDWFQVLNVSEEPTNINVIVRDRDGKVFKQFGVQNLGPMNWWNFTDQETGNINGTVEIMSTQPITCERHMHYQAGHLGSAVGQLGQVIDRPAHRQYFPEISDAWADWIQIVNVGNAPGKVTVIARDQNGNAVWSQEKVLEPFQVWNPDVEQIKQQTSVTAMSDQHILAERHAHSGTQILNFPGASRRNRTIGRRLFFPEIYSGGLDWFRFLNVSEETCYISLIARDRDGKVAKQLNSPPIPPMGWWIATDTDIGNITGTLEALCTQNTVGERHLHYSAQVHAGVAVGQFGQVLD
ncbi:TPA: hypothetical protein ENX78_05360 [Candidatus Poribacteria bacterium]|nr:hypothetical protein [Candidatus Poribacteria bacterium]